MSLGITGGRPGYNPVESLSAAVSQGTHADLGHLGHDPDLAAKILRKRQAEIERRNKLFDPRTRQNGVNHSVLNAQLVEKRTDLEMEAGDEAFHANNALVADQVAQVCEQERQIQARQRQQATIDYSLANLRKEQRREWELSDPTAQKNERPARDGDDDPRLGISSMQVFQGEDVFADMKQKEAKVMQRQWLLEQIAEKQARAAEEQEADRQYDKAVLTANEVRTLCERATQQEMREDKIEEAEENKRMAAAHQARRQAKAQREAQEAKKHITGIMQSDRMRETHDYKMGPDGRLQRTEYKRVTLEEENSVYALNRQMALDRAGQKFEDARQEAEHASNTLKATHVLGAIEDEQRRQQVNRHKQMNDANRIMAEEKRAKDAEERRTRKSFEHEP